MKRLWKKAIIVNEIGLRANKPRCKKNLKNPEISCFSEKNRGEIRFLLKKLVQKISKNISSIKPMIL